MELNSPKVERQEGNRIIAEFIGGHERYWYDTLDLVWDSEDWKNPLAGGKHSDDLKYHTSWDWLMPVVEKIEETLLNNEPVWVVIQDHNCDIRPLSGFITFTLEEENSKIEAVWLAVIAFITYHNKTK